MYQNLVLTKNNVDVDNLIIQQMQNFACKFLGKIETYEAKNFQEKLILSSLHREILKIDKYH